VTFETGVHWLYRLLYWFDDYRIESYLDDRDGGVEANAEVACRLTLAGREIPCEMYFSADHGGDNACLIYGSRAVARVDDVDTEGVACRFASNSRLGMRVTDSLNPVGQSPNWQQYEDFHALVTGDPAACNPLNFGIRALEFLLDCYAIRQPWPQPWTE
jgi:predicted dehydrogenase